MGGRLEEEAVLENRDLRGWIERAEQMGELRKVDGADWDLEIGAVAELVHHAHEGPAVLFDSIKGYERGKRVLINSIGSLKRLAMTAGFEEATSPIDFIKAWRRKSKTFSPLGPKFVGSGSLLENVKEKGDVDMLKFPAPRWHELDGGRYIGTGSVTITRDPDEGWVNLGTYRVMVHDRDTLGFYISPGKHGRIQRDKYFSKGESFKVAISFGHDPIFFLAGSIEVPYGLSEYDYIGGMLGRPAEVIKGEYSGLPIPASAEIAIEGDALREGTRPEGPFGEWTGYYASASRLEPIIKVKRLMYRDDPIILGSPPGKPPYEGALFRSYVRSALIWEELEKAGVPDVKGVWCPVAGGSRLIVVVSIKQRYAGHARQAAFVASQCHAAAYLGRYVIIVDDDIDPTNLNDLLWALGTRSDPATSIDFIRRAWSGPLDPMGESIGAGYFNSRAIIDACKPYERIDTFPPVAQCSPELRRATAEKWGKFLF